MARSPALTGILFAIGGTLIFSVNDVSIKFLSGGYALHQVILIRAIVAMAFILAVIHWSDRGWSQMRTQRPTAHLLRVAIVMLSNVTYFTGLAVMDLADAVAVAYVSPIVITLLSILVLGEKVGPRRWAAVIVGMVGVIVMLRPGSGVIQPAALLVLISAVLYAAGNLLARHLGGTESAMTLSFYVQAGFIFVSLAMGAFAGDGPSRFPAPRRLVPGLPVPGAADWAAVSSATPSVIASITAVTTRRCTPMPVRTWNGGPPSWALASPTACSGGI